MIDFQALMRRAEHELAQEETLVRTVKTGIVFTTLSTTMQKYGGQITNVEVLAVLEILARHGKLYESLQLSDLRAVLSTTGTPSPGIRPAEEPVAVEEPLSFEDIQESETLRRALHAQHPEFSDHEINAIVEAQMRTRNPNVMARTDEDLALHEAAQRNPFPGAPLGTPLPGFTMTDPVEPPSDLAPTSEQPPKTEP